MYVDMDKGKSLVNLCIYETLQNNNKNSTYKLKTYNTLKQYK